MLHDAASHGHTEIVALLLKQTDAASVIDLTPSVGTTALYETICRRDLKTASVLISYGANPNIFPSFRGTPVLCSAAENGDLELVKLLGKAGAEMNARRSKDGATPLCISAMRGDIDVVSYLLEKDADVNLRTSSSGSPPLLLAAFSGDVRVISLLLHYGADVNKSLNNSGASPLFIAAQLGHFGAVRYLVENGAKVNHERGSDRSTPLHIAAQKGFLEIVSFLCDSGAMMTPNALSVATVQGHLEVVRYLVDEGVVAQANDVIAAAKKSHIDIVLFLVKEAGIPVEATNTSAPQRTALFYLVKRKASHEHVRLLLQKGARVDVCVASSSKTLACLASKKRNPRVLRLLLKFAKKRNAKLHVDIPDRKGKTALWYASKYGQFAIIRLLLKEGARVTAADKKARSCIDIASQKGKADVASLLIDTAYSANKWL